MLVLTQFVLRLSFGLALAMGLTSPQKVTSGFFRNHSYVLLGLNVLATLAAVADRGELLLWPPLIAAILSYFAAAVWLYEKPRVGILLLWAIAACSLLGALLTQPLPPLDSYASLQTADIGRALWAINPITGGLLLGATITAMFLGHWYLNTPTMELAPLKKLVLLMAAAVLARGAVCAVGTILQWQATGLTSTQLLMVGLRWASGIVGAAGLCWMTWQTLKIPNTQSATGILYVGVIVTFLGELTSQLLSAGTLFPV